ncbi:MAG TPA: carbohydrate ABC transporter permease [Candidatus Borkfalkia excrementavium]|uniref:Carbohydrate ABC transporter permease n=1 Tax=Candidatus Borkfalkia excrementavium TaxID=2838505 RepID=A0A9D2CFV4_9FIRM|nr:carbohydrate ABC transporter permease [Candidatus Borkfalkia excrementavium]
MKNRGLSLRSPYAIVTLCILILYVVSLLFPSAWGLWTAMKSNLDYLGDPLGLPDTWHFENFLTALDNYMVQVFKDGRTYYFYIESMLLFSLLYAVGAAFFTTFVCCLVAYVTSRFNFVFNKVVYGIVIVTMTLPIVGSLPSEIQMLKMLNLYDNIVGMWVLKSNFLGLYYLVFYSTFKSLPKDYSEAAYIDGASNFVVFVRIGLPLVRNIFFTIMLIKFIEFWNDYTATLTYMPSYPTLAFGLYEYSFSAAPEINNTPMRMAGCFVLAVPILIVFLFTHDRMMSNLSMGGVKE